MEKNPTGRRSSTIPVRISQLDREDKKGTRSDARRTQTLKTKSSLSVDSSHIPKPRQRASSCERPSTKGSLLKVLGRTPLSQYSQHNQHGPGTPATPGTSRTPRLGRTPSKATTKFNPALATGRRSLSADRASSLGAKGSRKDTRPLLDKAYQAGMLAKVDSFLNENQQLGILNANGSIKPITLKMFVEVSALLIKMLGIKQMLTISNYVEEIPKIAKKLHYPGTITKSWLKTANAMHSWPNVLGWLCWLTEICEINQVAHETYSLDLLPFKGNEWEAEFRRNSFFAMLRFYHAWNDEKHEEEEILVNEYLRDMEYQQGITDEDLEKVSSEMQEDLLKLEAITTETDNIDEEVHHLKEELETLRKKESKSLDDIKSTDEDIRTTRTDINPLNEACKPLCEEIQLLNIQQDQLLLCIKEQPMSRSERDKLLEKCMATQNYIDQYNEHLTRIQNELYNLDMKLSSVNNALNKTILTHNRKLLMDLDSDIGIDLEELKLPETGMLHLQIIDVLSAKANLMVNAKDFLNKQLNEQKPLMEKYEHEIVSLEEKIKAFQDKVHVARQKTKKMKKQQNRMKAKATDEETRLQEQIRILEVEINEIQERMPNMEKINAEMKEVTDKLDAVRRRKLYIEETAKLFFNQFYEILGAHHNRLHNLLLKDKRKEV